MILSNPHTVSTSWLVQDLPGVLYTTKTYNLVGSGITNDLKVQETIKIDTCLPGIAIFARRKPPEAPRLGAPQVWCSKIPGPKSDSTSCFPNFPAGFPSFRPFQHVLPGPKSKHNTLNPNPWPQGPAPPWAQGLKIWAQMGLDQRSTLSSERLTSSAPPKN